MVISIGMIVSRRCASAGSVAAAMVFATHHILILLPALKRHGR